MSAKANSQKVKRLLEELELPAHAARVLDDPDYWTEAFCLAYFDACDETLFEDPRPAFSMAEIAPLLARRIPGDRCEKGAVGRAELEVHGLAIHGGACRALGELQQAEEIYGSALKIADSAGVGAEARANLARRLAILRIAQEKTDEALELAREAVEFYRQNKSWQARQNLAWALTVQAGVLLEVDHVSEGIQALTEALSHADARRSPRIYFSILNNLGLALTRGGSHPADLATALSYQRKARRLLRGGKRSLPRLKLRWNEAVILAKFGSTRRAEVGLRRVRDGLIELEIPYEVALISLDLSALYRDEGRWREVRQLASETCRFFSALAADRQASAALLMWHEAALAKALDDEVLGQVRTTLERRAAKRR